MNGRNAELSGVRFAPSPTGRFHVGNFRTAWISWALAKSLAQPWIVRVEDIDKARAQEKFCSNPETGQLAEMASLGLIPDEIYFQSSRSTRHEDLFHQAIAEGKIYACDCSRSEVREALAALASAPHAREPEYSGHCRTMDGNRELNPVESLAWRWKSADASGRYDVVIARTQPDRSLFQPGYHFACALDDVDGGYRLLVRAWDLASADETQKQIREWIKPNCGTRVFHSSLVTQDGGQRLEKRTKGVTLTDLAAEGLGGKKLVQLFEKTFEIKKAIADIAMAENNFPTSVVLGEARKTLTLSDLAIRL